MIVRETYDMAIEAKLKEAEHRALDALARYKFMSFGYWAAMWVHFNKLEGNHRPNPFRPVVYAARALKNRSD
jgi:hypothetical protein